MKLGLDIHGVIDEFPETFAAISQAMVAAGHEVHVITGPREEVVKEELQRYGIAYTHFFSIVDYLDEHNITITWEDGKPYADTYWWDRAKGEYCKDVGIDLHIDDSPRYGHHFKTPYAKLGNR